MPASLPDDLQDALSLGSVEARAGGTGLDVLEDVVGALARLAIEGGRAVVAQPVVVEVGAAAAGKRQLEARSEEHTSELQSLMRISYAVFCLTNKKITPLSHTIFSII